MRTPGYTENQSTAKRDYAIGILFIVIGVALVLWMSPMVGYVMMIVGVITMVQVQVRLARAPKPDPSRDDRSAPPWAARAATPARYLPSFCAATVPACLVW